MRSIELYINGRLADLGRGGLGIKLNNVLYSPDELVTRQGEYSFSFTLPSTPNNDVIFSFASVPSSRNKFVGDNSATLYIDGVITFTGSIIVNSYKDGEYSVNLVAIKAIDYNGIFGEAKLSELEWYIPFKGASSINEYNMEGGDVVFPLISYGAFQKAPRVSDEVGNVYTSKFELDEWNRWYLESFYPSPRLFETVRKCFEQKGYSVYGDVFNDETLKGIYQSVHLEDSQDPAYNLAEPSLGRVVLTVSGTTSGKSAYEQELAFPYFKVTNRFYSHNGTGGETEYNLGSVAVYDLLSIGDIQMYQSPCYMFQPNEHIIVAPADGFYKIDIDVKAITQPIETFSADCWTWNGTALEEGTTTVTTDMLEQTPIEIQLVRNYEDSIELIKGRHNKRYTNGNPNDTVFQGSPNAVEWLTCFPHNDPYNAVLPTEKNNLSFRNTNTRTSRGNSSSVTARTNGGVDSEAEKEGRRGGSGASRVRSTTSRGYTESMKGYVYPTDSESIMAYDAAANPNFVCGFSTFFGGVPSVIKNGRSWSDTIGETNESFYNIEGYSKVTSNGGVETLAPSDKERNEYLDAPSSYFYSRQNQANGYLSCMVWLNKNDVLQLFGVHRAYHRNGILIPYTSNFNIAFSIEAASNSDYASLRARNYGYGSSSDFDKNLRIGNFLSSETTMARFVENAAKAFNLSVTQVGTDIFINKKQRFGEEGTCIIDFDAYADAEKGEISPVDFPSEMSMAYTIDTEEYGFEQSVPSDKINLKDFDKYGDSGYSVIKLSEEAGRSKVEENVDFSYTWYGSFEWHSIDASDVDTGARLNIWLPVISKAKYMIDGYDYTDSLKYDGYGLPMRLWSKPSKTDAYVWLDSYPAEKVDIYTVGNMVNGLNLSYKNTEKSILTEYFSIYPNTSTNYLTVELYLSSNDYIMLTNGGRVRIDSDIYYVTEIEHFSLEGDDKTVLKLLKR